jgi:hypothetical protein
MEPVILVLTLQILGEMKPQQFTFKAKPQTLKITQTEMGVGNYVTVEDGDNKERMWYASRIMGLLWVT